MKTILIAEDDRSLNKSISFALSAQGFKVIETFSVSEAIDNINGADMLLLDMMLPDGRGTEICAKARRTSNIPVIFLTSCDDESEITGALDNGADDYITKPFRLAVLISRVNAVFRRCVSDKPETVELTATEQKLLEYLIINKEQYVTRTQILSYLWDSKGCFVNDNALSVSISRLREKLRDSDEGQIVTKRGLGYKWTQQKNS